MARIKSPTWTLARGSVGGTNYFAGPQHQILARGRSSPVRPTSSDSTLYRSSFAEAALAWRLMSTLQRTAWADWAATLYFLSPTGSYTVTGRNAFLGYYPLHRYLHVLGLTFIQPTTNATSRDGWLTFIPYIGPQQHPPVGTLTVSLINGSPAEVILVYLQVSRPFDSSRLFFKGPWTTRSAAVKTIFPGGATAHLFTGLRRGATYFVHSRAITVAPSGARYSKPAILRATVL